MAWLAGWAKRIKLTIDAGDIDADLANFPVLVYISASSGINGEDISCVFDELTSDANRLKIAVTTDDGLTECKVEIEKWVDSAETAWLWVKVPSIDDAVNTDLYLYYDHTHADNTTNVGDIESVPAEAVWESNFRAVYHMRDKTTSSVAESTTNNLTGTKSAANQPIEDTGKIDKGQKYAALNTDINHADDALLDFTNSFSIEFWMKVDNTHTAQIQALVYKYYNLKGYQVRICRTDEGAGVVGHIRFYAIANSTTPLNVDSNTRVDDNTWRHIVCTRSADGKIRVYVNGVIDSAVVTLGSAGDQSNAVAFWMMNDDNFDWDYYGAIDEVRLSQIERPAEYIKADYETGRDHLLDWGTEETPAVDHYVTVIEIIGCLDTKSRTKTIHRTITEKLGLKDTRSRTKTINRIVTELLGLKDVRWLPSLPPIPPVFKAVYGKIKKKLYDVFLGLIEQPAIDNPRVQCDIIVNLTETRRITAKLKRFLTELNTEFFAETVSTLQLENNEELDKLKKLRDKIEE